MPSGRRADLIFAVVSVLLLGLLALTASNGEWLSDTWIHSATLSEVARHPLHPLEPLTGEAASFPYFSPWAMTLGWFMHLTGASVFVTLTIGGLISTAFLLLSWRRFALVLSPSRGAPLLSLSILLLLWGTRQWFWSGFPGIGTLTVGFTWPSIFAAAMWFTLWRNALLLGQVRMRATVACFLTLPGLILLVHPFTAAIAGLSVALTILPRWTRHRRHVIVAVACAAASGLLAAAWPWMRLSDLTSDTGGFDDIHRMLYGHSMFITAWVLTLVTVPALGLRLRRNRLDPLAWTAIVCALGLAAGRLTQVWSLGRLGPGVALPGQFALAAELVNGWRDRRAQSVAVRRGYASLGLASLLALFVGLNASLWAVARAIPNPFHAQRVSAEKTTHASALYPALGWMSGYLHDGDTAVTNYWEIRRELPTYGLRTVMPPWPSPGLDDQQQRTNDESEILSAKISESTRQRLLSKYHVAWIIWSPSATAPNWPFPGARTVACSSPGIVLLRIDPTATSAGACPS
jgi:hypothetical protein